MELTLNKSGFHYLQQCSLHNVRVSVQTSQLCRMQYGEQKPLRLTKFLLITNLSLYNSQSNFNWSSIINPKWEQLLLPITRLKKCKSVNQSSKQWYVTSSKVGGKCICTSHDWYSLQASSPSSYTTRDVFLLTQSKKINHL